MRVRVRVRVRVRLRVRVSLRGAGMRLIGGFHRQLLGAAWGTHGMTSGVDPT